MRIVIALGGNALLSPSGRQSLSTASRNMDRVSESIARLCKRDYQIVITHGNGSEVGDELIRSERARRYVPEYPLHILNAETQASIGTIIVTSLMNRLNAFGIRKDVCMVLAHTLVDRNDEAFKNPKKPIGPFYTKAELRSELRVSRFDYIKHGSKYRRVVASPKPLEILELNGIREAMRTGIVVTAGGGGIPVMRQGKGFKEIDAVIDKDLTSQLLANSIGADRLVVLTDVDYIYSGRRMSDPLKEVRAGQLKKILNRLEEGTIRPKAEACANFIKNGGKEAYVGNVFRLESILAGNSGTRVID